MFTNSEPKIQIKVIIQSNLSSFLISFILNSLLLQGEGSVVFQRTWIQQQHLIYAEAYLFLSKNTFTRVTSTSLIISTFPHDHCNFLKLRFTTLKKRHRINITASHIY